MTPRRRLRRGAIIGIAAAILVLLAAGAALALWLVGRGDSPEAVAQRYLDALADGDGDAARATFADGAAPTTDTLDAFESASAYLTRPAVAGAETSADDSTSVKASFFLAGGMHIVTFTVRQQDGRWVLGDDALGAITATTTLGDAVSVGGVMLETSASLKALPAAYEVAAAPGQILTGTAEAVVTPGGQTQVAVEASFAPDASAHAQSAVDAYLKACTRSSAEAPATTSPTACGIRIPWGADLASADGFVFRVETLPTVALDATGGFIATGGSYVATVSGLTREGTPADYTYRDASWTLRGGLDFEGGELVLRAW